MPTWFKTSSLQGFFGKGILEMFSLTFITKGTANVQKSFITPGNGTFTNNIVKMTKL